MRTITLTHDKVALVDDEDYEQLMCHKWHAREERQTWYAYTTASGGVRLAMHNCLVVCEENETVDHRDRDGLNNQKHNLRPATLQQQACNTIKLQGEGGSGYRGVAPERYGKHTVRITVNRQRLYIGTYSSAEEAARAYDEKAIQLHGAFAILNFPVTE